MNHGQAQSCPLADAFGREERLGGALERRLVHAFAGIGNGQANVFSGSEPAMLLAGRFFPRRDDDRTLAMHGIAGVHGEIEQGGLELIGIGLDLREVIVDPNRDRNRRLQRALH